jgi:hypothetical protein
MAVRYCDNPSGLEKHKDKLAEFVRPSEKHASGNLAAQHLCDGCADSYDNNILGKQKSYREQRKKDLEKRHLQKTERN